MQSIKHALLLAGLAFGGTAAAATVTYDFTAVAVDSVYGVAKGTEVTGSFTINPNATGLTTSSNASSATFTGSDAAGSQVFTASVNLGATSTIGSTFSLPTNQGAFSSNDSVSGILNPAAGGTFVGTQQVTTGTLSPVVNLQTSTLSVSFGPLTGYSFLSSTSPLLNLTSAQAAIAANVVSPPTNEAVVQITYDNGLDLNLQLQSVTPVPLPPSLPLLLGGVGVFGFALRNKART